MKIKNNILYRYESKMDNGVLFIFDIEKYKVYKGSILEYYLLSLVHQGLNQDDIIDKFSSDLRINADKDQISSLFDFMLKNEIVEE